MRICRCGNHHHQEIYRESMARNSFTLVMLAIAGAWLVLGIIRIYGVISYRMQRTRDRDSLRWGAQKTTLSGCLSVRRWC